MNTARKGLAGGGSSSDVSIAFGGIDTSAPDSEARTVKTEKYNGTNWTEVGDMNTARASQQEQEHKQQH